MKHALVEQSGVLATLSRWRPRVRIPPGALVERRSRKGASAGQRSAQVAVTHPPSGIAGSSPARRTRFASRHQRIPRRGGRPAGSHKAGPPGSTPGPGTRIRRHGTQTGKAARSRAWCLWVRIPPVLLVRPVVQRQRHLSYKEGRGVRFPPGRLDLKLKRCAGTTTGGWSNGKTPGLHPGDRGSIPRPVHFACCEVVRKAAGYG